MELRVVFMRCHLFAAPYAFMHFSGCMVGVIINV